MMLGALDITVIVAWLALTLGIGIWAGLRATPSLFWVNDRNAATAPLVMSVISTQVGAGALAGIAAATYAGGTGFGAVSLFSTVVGFLLVSHFAPAVRRFGERHNAFTLGEIFRVRYGRSAQVAASAVLLICYAGILAAQFVATTQLIAAGTGLGFNFAVAFAVAGVLAYSAFAGLRGDIVTDIWHMAGMSLVLFAIILPFVFLSLPEGAVQDISAHLWDPATFGGYSFLIAGFLFGAFVPLLMPEIWLKVYASRTPTDANRVMRFAALGVIPFYLGAISLGLIGSITHPQLANPDVLIFEQLGHYVPPVLLGFGVAAILSIILSTANSLIVVFSATAARDLLGLEVLKDRSLLTSRLLTLAAGAVGVALSLLVPDLVNLLLGAFYMLLVLIPSLIGAYLGRGTRAAAVTSMTLGALATLTFLAIAPREAFIPGLLISILSYILVSLFTQPAEGEGRDELRLSLRAR